MKGPTPLQRWWLGTPMQVGAHRIGPGGGLILAPTVMQRHWTARIAHAAWRRLSKPISATEMLASAGSIALVLALLLALSPRLQERCKSFVDFLLDH